MTNVRSSDGALLAVRSESTCGMRFVASVPLGPYSRSMKSDSDTTHYPKGPNTSGNLKM